MGWETVFVWAYEAARSDFDASLVADGLLAMSRLDRKAVEFARLHMLGHVVDRPDDQVGHRALRLIAAALNDGDQRSLWRSPPNGVDAWAVAQHRL